MNSKSTVLYTIAAICFLFISGFPVNADTLTVYEHPDGASSGEFAYYGVTNVLLTYNSHTSTTTTDAGMILVNNGGDTWAFCVDLLTELRNGDYEDFIIENPADYNQNLLYVEWILNDPTYPADDAYALKSNYRGAGLQLAIWEILIDFNIYAVNYGLNYASSMYGTEANKFWYYNLNSSLDYAGNKAVNDWYDYYIGLLIKANQSDLLNLTSSGDYIVADFSQNQDLIVKVVPEPATALLLGVGLLGLCAVGRKKDSVLN